MRKGKGGGEWAGRRRRGEGEGSGGQRSSGRKGSPLSYVAKYVTGEGILNIYQQYVISVCFVKVPMCKFNTVSEH